jgi:hypothetical protein
MRRVCTLTSTTRRSGRQVIQRATRLPLRHTAPLFSLPALQKCNYRQVCSLHLLPLSTSHLGTSAACRSCYRCALCSGAKRCPRPSKTRADCTRFHTPHALLLPSLFYHISFLKEFCLLLSQWEQEHKCVTSEPRRFHNLIIPCLRNHRLISTRQALPTLTYHLDMLRIHAPDANSIITR